MLISKGFLLLVYDLGELSPETGLMDDEPLAPLFLSIGLIRAMHF